jgi:hypothetical protein
MMSGDEKDVCMEEEVVDGGCVRAPEGRGVERPVRPQP